MPRLGDHELAVFRLFWLWLGLLDQGGCLLPKVRAFPTMKTILLLVASNVFMTLAWYGHLKIKFFEGKSVFWIILFAWSVAFFEYCLMIPANRAGYMSGTFTGYQLKIVQECVTLGVFVIFAWLVLKEKLTWNYAVSFAFILGAIYFATAFKPGGTSPGGH